MLLECGHCDEGCGTILTDFYIIFSDLLRLELARMAM